MGWQLTSKSFAATAQPTTAATTSSPFALILSSFSAHTTKHCSLFLLLSVSLSFGSSNLVRRDFNSRDIIIVAKPLWPFRRAWSD